jgi:hypothetical protein
VFVQKSKKVITMNQKQRLLDYLEAGNTVTTLDAFRKLGITRISAVVYDLKKEGHKLITERVTVKNHYGEKCSVCRWSLPCN